MSRMPGAQDAVCMIGGMERNTMLFAVDTEDRWNSDALLAKRDERKLEELIRKSRRFILGCAYRTTHRFITQSDDEWSVALIAFHEAVKSYELEKGSFKQFAALVIKRRLMDEFEKNARRSHEIPTDMSGAGLDQEDEPAPIQLEVRKRVTEEAIRRQEEESSVRDEIDAVSQSLGGYGISFFDLAECSPKAQKTKAACAVSIRTLIGDAALMSQMLDSGTLPIKKICERTGVPRKILENHRKYIIAAAVILSGDYPQLAEYLRYVKEGGEAG